MSICAAFDTSGYLVQVAETVDECAHYVLVAAEKYRYLSSMVAPTPEELLYLYSWGMVAVLLPWSLAYAIGVAKGTIKKL